MNRLVARDERDDAERHGALQQPDETVQGYLRALTGEHGRDAIGEQGSGDDRRGRNSSDAPAAALAGNGESCDLCHRSLMLGCYPFTDPVRLAT